MTWHAVLARARMLPDAGTRRVFNKIVKRYWHHAIYFIPQALLRGGVDKVHAAIEVVPVGAAHS